MAKLRRASLAGRNAFQAALIKRSYRNRGRVARNHTQKKHKRAVTPASGNGDRIPKKTWALIKEKNIIIPYSAINKKAKPPPEYSILNPDTSSDSPSAKSKGVRLVSATALIIHKIVTGGTTAATTEVCSPKRAAPLNVLPRIKATATITANLTS